MFLSISMQRRRVLIWSAAVLAAALAAVWWRRPPTVMAEMAVVTEGPLAVTVNDVGTTRVRSHADIAAPVTGTWIPATMRAGDVVQAGARLGVLVPAALDASARAQAESQVGIADATLRELEARLVAARTAFEEARRSRDRLDALGTAGAVSAQDVERARAAFVDQQSNVDALLERLRAARYARDVARSTLEVARGRGTAMPLVSPLAGTVLRVHEEHERAVVAGTLLVEVGDARDLEVIVPLLTADALRVREGAPVRLTFGDGLAVSGSEATADTVMGTVRRVEPAAYRRLSALGVEEQRTDVVATVPATALHLGDRFRADARITVWEAARVVRVPVAALVRDGDAWAVWVVRRGRASRRPVQLGARGEMLAEVRGGLAPGDSVVVFPGERLADGVRVKAGR